MTTPFSDLLSTIDASYQALIKSRDPYNKYYPVSRFRYLFYVEVQFADNSDTYTVAMINENKEVYGLSMRYHQGEMKMQIFAKEIDPDQYIILHNSIETLLERLTPCKYDITKFPPPDNCCTIPSCKTRGKYVRTGGNQMGIFFPKEKKCMQCNGKLLTGDLDYAHCLECKINYSLSKRCGLCGDRWCDHLPIFDQKLYDRLRERNSS